MTATHNAADPVHEYFTAEPAFANRAFMLDISRDRVPTRETLDWLVGILSTLRITELHLYIEHTFAFAGHEAVWESASALTAQDMAWLAGRARANGVELVANVNTFGHMERWLKHDDYRHRAEAPEGAMSPFSGKLAAPSCLAPTQDNADFALALASELLAAVGGNRIHIGGDEPFDLGLGASADRVANEGKGTVYREHLGRIIEPLVERGHDVLFWGDQFRTDTAAIEWIPDGATCVIWNYEAPTSNTSGGSSLTLIPQDVLAALGMPKDSHLGFEAHARLVAASNKPFWVGCGTGSWNTIIGRNTNAAANIDDAVVTGRRLGATGAMLTDWGDNGHWQPLAVSLPSLVRFAINSFCGVVCDVDVGMIIDHLLGAAPGTGAALDAIGHVGEGLGASAINATPIATAMIDIGLPTFGEADHDAVALARDLVATSRTTFASAFAADDARGAIIATELDAACALADLGLRRLINDEPTTAELEVALDAQRAAWLLSSQPGGLDDSLSRLTT